MVTIETQKFPNIQGSLIFQITEFLNQKTKQYLDFYYLQNQQISLPDGSLIETEVYHLPDQEKDYGQLLDSLVDLLNHIIWETQVYLVPGKPLHYCFQVGNISHYEIHASNNYLTLIHYYSGQQ